MNKQTIVLIGFALLLAALYVAFFTDLFGSKNIQISWRISPSNGSLVFYLDKEYALTSLEVVPTEEAKTNKYPHELWHVVAQAAPVTLATFNYGQAIPGMKPKVATAVPEQLQPDIDYSLVVATRSGMKGETNFLIHAKPN